MSRPLNRIAGIWWRRNAFASEVLVVHFGPGSIGPGNTDGGLMRRTRIASIAALAAATVLVPAAAAQGEGGGVAPTPPTAQNRTLADRVTDTVEPLAWLFDRSGFAGTAVDYDSGTVTLRWAGDVPADVRAMAADPAPGVTVNLVAAQYSEKELAAAGRAVVDDDGEDLSGQPEVLYAMPLEDRSGLTTVLAEDVQGTPAREVEQDLSELAEVPVDVEVSPEPEYPDLARPNDSSPWQGGGALNKGGAGRDNHHCSTGFAVLTGGGQGRLLTAAHCYNTVDAVVNDGAGDRVGSISKRAPNFDAALIDTNGSPGTIGKVFTGGWGSGSSRFVGGAAPPSEGERVCTSGANSGEHCGRIIRRTSVQRRCVRNQYECEGFLASGSGGVTAVAGDSGGPIYIVRDDGRVGARGLINQGSGNSVACGSTRANPAPACFSGVFSVGIHKVLSALNVRIET